MRQVPLTADEVVEARAVRRYVESRQRKPKVSLWQQQQKDFEDETAFNRQFLRSAGVRLKPARELDRLQASARRAPTAPPVQADYDPYQEDAAAEDAAADNTPFPFDEGYDKWRDRPWESREYASTANSVATRLMQQHNNAAKRSAPPRK